MLFYALLSLFTSTEPFLKQSRDLVDTPVGKKQTSTNSCLVKCLAGTLFALNLPPPHSPLLHSTLEDMHHLCLFSTAGRSATDDVGLPYYSGMFNFVFFWPFFIFTRREGLVGIWVCMGLLCVGSPLTLFIIWESLVGLQGCMDLFCAGPPLTLIYNFERKPCGLMRVHGSAVQVLPSLS